MAKRNDPQLRALIREEAERIIREDVVPLLAEEIIRVRDQLRAELQIPQSEQPPPARLHLVDPDEQYHLSSEDVVWMMDQAHGQ